MISVNSLFILSYYSNIWIQSIFVLKSEWWKTVMFSNIGSPRDIYEKTHFIFKTMIAYKIFFWKRNKLGEKSRFFFLRLGAKWDFSLVQGKTLSLLSYLAFSVSVNAQSAYLHYFVAYLHSFSRLFSCLIALYFPA